MAVKKKSKAVLTSTFLIIADSDFKGKEDDFENAKTLAEGLCDGHSNVQILEVTNVWNVQYPEEPDVEIYKTKLENIEL